MIGYRKQHFLLLSQDNSLTELVTELWPQAALEWTTIAQGRGAIERIFNDPPDLLLVDRDLPDMDGLEIVRLVKGENVYRQVPVVICLQESSLPDVFSKPSLEFDDFLLRPFKEEEVKRRLELTWQRSTKSLDANPLTKLPGNTSIIQKIQELIDRKDEFALAYVDLDNFKAFNDKYGFSRGDEVLMMTSRVIVNTVRATAGSSGFVGHIGGDDFVFILSPDRIEQACQGVIRNFDSIVPHFYNSEDRRAGCIRSLDRQGNECVFSLMTLSIAVVFNRQGGLQHSGQAAQIAMNLKKKAKQESTSSYVLDRRTYT